VNPLARRAAVVAAAVAVDRRFGEPPARVHPVAAFGTAMGALERRIWRDRRGAGVAYAAAGTLLGGGVGVAARTLAGPVGDVTVAATATAGRELRRVATTIGDALDHGDLTGARAALPSLVGRDPSALDASGIAAAVIESLAENTVDAVVCTLWWTALAGGPGAAAHRAVNTMDAMVGHHSERYERFGWAAARLDDAAAWIPARLFVALVMAVRPRRARAVWATVRRDGPKHPSPNAGVAEAAVAAALGVELGGPLRYGDRREDRPRLGDGPRPGPADVRRALRLVDDVERAAVAAAVTAGVAATAATARRRHRRAQR
jgi:adenosylcobinamide-phosphate synthase